MTDRRAKPTLTEAGKQAQDRRRLRQAQALRANLARRKARDRKLETASAGSGDKTAPDRSGGA